MRWNVEINGLGPKIEEQLSEQAADTSVLWAGALEDPMKMSQKLIPGKVRVHEGDAWYIFPNGSLHSLTHYHSHQHSHVYASRRAKAG